LIESNKLLFLSKTLESSDVNFYQMLSILSVIPVTLYDPLVKYFTAKYFPLKKLIY